MIKVEYNPKTPKVWTLLEDYSRDGVTVPAGFTTDLASTPRFIWALYPRWDRYAPAAVVHDYLCLNGMSYTGKQMDDMFHKHMIEDGVKPHRAFIMWLCVRIFGSKRW